MNKNIDPIDLIEKLPYDFAAALEADPFFNDIPIVVADEGDVEATIARKQAVIEEKCGRKGVAVIVLQILGDDEYPDLYAGPLALFPAFEVIEQRQTNRDKDVGTGKSARKVARQIIKVIKPLAAAGFYEGLKPDKNCLIPVPSNADEPANLLRYQVNFKCYEADDDKSYAILPAPDFAQNQPGTFALTCANQTAQIFYTLDDSFPNPNNMSTDDGVTGTSLFGAGDNIAVPAQGFFVRARAYPPKGAQQSGTILIPSMVTRAFMEPN